MMTKTCSIALGAALFGCAAFCASPAPVAKAVSPDGRNEIRLWTHPLSIAASRDGQELLLPSKIGLKVDGKKLGAKPGKAPVVTTRQEKGSVPMAVYKKSVLNLSGTFAKVDFGDWGVELAARDDGVAYRFYTAMPDEIIVNKEKADFTLPRAARCWFYTTGRVGCEEAGMDTSDTFAAIDTSESRVAYLPFVASAYGKTIAILESDVNDYPILNFEKDGGDDELEAELMKFPRLKDPKGSRTEVIGSEDYLVWTAGTRTFPWRAFALVDAPYRLCETDLVMALARPPAKDADFSWVRPGKVSWDWWNSWENKGFAEGCNTATYKRFVDFAAKHGLEYILMDEGWSEGRDIWKFNPKVDVPEIIRYGKEKGVGVILWMAWNYVVGEEEKVASHFAKLGAAGFKVDYMDRGDADVERFLWDFAAACAKNRMIVDYHGVHRPTGMMRMYPNVLNYEGVLGLEFMRFDAGVDFRMTDLGAFFLRMTQGPMDYTPGAMDHYTFGKYDTDGRLNPGSYGTRCRQLAMMSAFEAPLQMLADAPSKYEKNAECLAFIEKIPTVWANVVGLGGDPDSYAAVARQTRDGAWYASAIGNRDARTITVDTAFLGNGDWTMEVFRDADDADVQLAHYVHETKSVTAGEKLTIRLAACGGFAAKFTKR